MYIIAANQSIPIQNISIRILKDFVPYVATIQKIFAVTNKCSYKRSVIKSFKKKPDLSDHVILPKSTAGL